MKTKTIILLGVAALVTLSFTFAKVNEHSTKASAKHSQSQTSQNEPVGGFAAEELVK